MKLISSLPIATAGIVCMLALQASAIEAPADEAPPPPMVEAAEAPAEQGLKPEAKAETAYLGVVSSTVPEMLAVHLGIKQGEGILVRAVMPDSPAAKAGIVVHDVITQVAGQGVGSAEDLTRVITSRKPGETLRLELIHEGKPSSPDVMLAVRPADIAGINPRPLEELELDGMPQDLADRVRGMIQGKLGRFEIPLGEDGGLEGAPQFDEAVREMKLRMEQAMQGLNVPELPLKGGIDVQQGATIRMLDGQGSIELKSSDGGKEVTIRDKNDQITWSGPWDTAQDKAAAPDEVRQRLERLHLDEKFQGNGLRLHLAPNADPE